MLVQAVLEALGPKAHCEVWRGRGCAESCSLVHRASALGPSHTARANPASMCSGLMSRTCHSPWRLTTSSSCTPHSATWHTWTPRSATRPCGAASCAAQMRSGAHGGIDHLLCWAQVQTLARLRAADCCSWNHPYHVHGDAAPPCATLPPCLAQHPSGPPPDYMWVPAATHAGCPPAPARECAGLDAVLPPPGGAPFYELTTSFLASSTLDLYIRYWHFSNA